MKVRKLPVPLVCVLVFVFTHALAGVAPSRRSASPSLVPSPEPSTQNPRCDPRVARFTLVQSTRQIECPSSIEHCAGKPAAARRRLPPRVAVLAVAVLAAAVRSQASGSDLI